MKTWMTITAVCIFVAGAALAQDGFKGQHRRSPDAAIAALSLTPEQITSLRDLRRSHFGEMRPLGGEIREFGRQLWEEMSKENPNPSIAGQFLVDMKASRNKIKVLQQRFQDQARGLLSENQQAALGKLESGREMEKAIREAASLGLLSTPHGVFRGRRGSGGFGKSRFGMRSFGGEKHGSGRAGGDRKPPF